ncbi:MAG TPA: VWA domain-containing protein [Blastocatellia bacterium]|nr:VWA domain-containing protein [Blastocatellia bacterium]
MKLFMLARVSVAALLVALLALSSAAPGSLVAAQSGRQPPKKKVEKKTEEKKANERQPAPVEEEVEGPPVPILRSGKDEPPLRISTQVVNVDTTVIDKKSGRLVPNLTQKNFIVYEDNVKQDITNFRAGEGPMTVVLLLDNGFQNRRWQGWFNPTFTQEIFQSAAIFTQRFVKPEDYVSIVTFSLKPKVIQDFTSDTNKLYNAILAAYRDTLNFSESNIYDALSFTLLGGKAIQLYDENSGPSEYVGLQEVEGHTAVILITIGIDTFSRITYDKALKIASGAGVPIFTVGVGNLFFKKYEHRMEATDRLTFLQAQNSLNAFAQRTGGAFFPMTFESELPTIMNSIQTLLRNQYSLGYDPSNTRREGKERKIKVEVDIDGDGQPDNKRLEVRHRQRYIEPDDTPKKDNKK